MKGSEYVKSPQETNKVFRIRKKILRRQIRCPDPVLKNDMSSILGREE